MKKKIPKELYKKIMENVPILCVDLIIKERGKILLVLRKNNPLKNRWWIPGGRVFKREKLEEAAKRKAKEECGLKIKSLKEIGTYSYCGKDSFFPGLKTGVHTVSIVFLAKIGKKNKIVIDSDHENFGWFNINNIPKELKKKINSII